MALGLRCDGRLLALNSYENRVYQVGSRTTAASLVVAKFYRPGRWSDAQILEEHAFAAELAEREIPVVAPLASRARTLHAAEGFRFAVFPRRGGRAPELDDPETLEWLGRFIGRIHAVGARAPLRAPAARSTSRASATSRAPSCSPAASSPPDLRRAVDAGVADLALEGVRARASSAPARCATLRLHGDCHAGNVLWTPQRQHPGGPHFVDLDDARMGPAVQDLWMLVSGDRETHGRASSGASCAGYEDFANSTTASCTWSRRCARCACIHYSRLARAALGRPGVPDRLPVVQHAALLAGPDPRAARAGRRDAGAAPGPAP